MIDVERQYQFDIEVDKTITFKKQLNVIRDDQQSSNSQSDDSTSPVVPGVFVCACVSCFVSYHVSHIVIMCYSSCLGKCYTLSHSNHNVL